ncbi:LuxR family transcriptional regulator, maltose regulon positive regulatory protein [Papillibacter cinnamivorans DSM 12816]|uniref:LuxR family transcriptional regulator, maltose regulon positive regulatory protein n=1 Tax=Papillibacter cinnamivorans DSM 12816 TaxID=1122930 RepID=A0A1W2AY58_9FIRM|nr:LuxR family transcriptional regulator, maltose regulon positive regulatory protein [Papillibacter cinnamivorans DSM 12816]
MKQKNINEPHYYSDRLRTKLNMLHSAPAAIFEAPSGYGKTTAVRDFLERELPKDTPVYWFTAAEELPTAGFRRLCGEINKIDGAAGERLLKIELPNAANVGEACDAFRSVRCGQESYFVIDNYQILQDFLLPPFFSALIEHGIDGLHIIIISQILNKNFRSILSSRGVLHITSADLRLDSEDICRYFKAAGAGISANDAKSLAQYTEGWIIAVFLQFCTFRETGTLSDTSGIMMLMEQIVWDVLTEEQKTFLLLVSAFDVINVPRACRLLDCETLPEYALKSLENPFIRYDPAERRYELHGIMSEMLVLKRAERGADFENACLLKAGDCCRDEGMTDKALSFYVQVKDYERMLSIDFSQLLLAEIGNTPFEKIALDIAMNCPADLKRRHLFSMLRVAWALLMFSMTEAFDGLMAEIQVMLTSCRDADRSWLLGEWTLLSSFKAYPHLAKMTVIVREAAGYFNGKCSRVILPTIPWCFGEFSPFAVFHTTPGEADREADALEEYLAVYSKLTNGSGAGADVLFRAELAFLRGNLTDAEILTYQAITLAESSQQSMVHLRSTHQLAEIALQKMDLVGWQNAIRSMERAASYAAQNTFVTRLNIDILRGILLNEMHEQQKVAEWLQKGDFSGRRTLPAIVFSARFVYFSFLMQQGEFTKLVGISQAYLASLKEDLTPFSTMLFYLTFAAGYTAVGNIAKAAEYIEYAADRAFPDGLIMSFASFSARHDAVTEMLINNKYPALLEKYQQVKARFVSGKEELRRALHSGDFPSDLTAREYEVAKLAAEGLRNSEIAERLFVTESTVRAHLRVVFQKLEIDRRAKLMEILR